MNLSDWKVLALVDSPTLTTGFARVAQNLFKRWSAAGVTIDCWAINFRGFDYRKIDYVRELYPAGVNGAHWYDPQNLTMFIARLMRGGYTHVWILQDTFLLSPNGFPKALADACKKHGIKSCLYFPVDAPLDPSWTRIVTGVHAPVAYTDYGKREAESKSGGQCQCSVIPHGVDTSIYFPIEPAARVRLRKNIRIRDERNKRERPWLKPDDFLMINVNANQRRKDPARSLEILAELKRRGLPVKLLMHMPESSSAGLSLEDVGAQLGLTLQEDWMHNGGFFRGSISVLTEQQLRELYHMADLYLTTTLGEGWGLTITEALACGLPVALPMHTACGEIFEQAMARGMQARMVPMPVEKHPVFLENDNSRMRYRTDVKAAADAIENYYRYGNVTKRPPLSDAMAEWLSWDRITTEFLKVMQKTKA